MKKRKGHDVHKMLRLSKDGGLWGILSFRGNEVKKGKLPLKGRGGL
jgi:hypothetical protein